MSLTNSPIWFGSGATGGGFYDYEINDSLRFDRASISYLNRTASSPTLGTKATWSFWIKKADVSEDTSSSYRTVFYAGTPNSDGFRIGFARYSGNGHSIQINQDLGSSSAYMYKLTNAFYRDVAGWYHFVISYDSTNATAADRIKVYANGELASFRTSPSTNPPLNHIPAFQVSGKTLKIGDGFGGAYNEAIDAYLADVYFIDGQALDGTSFAETKDGVWIPKAYGGSYGNNGFYLDFSNNSTATNLGLDSSGNSNNFSVNNIATTDQMIDTPTNNWCTLNQLSKDDTSVVYSEGSLQAINSTATSRRAYSTIAVKSGKWYFEYYVNAIGSSTTNAFGVQQATDVWADGLRAYRANGDYFNGSSWISYGATFTTGDIISFAVDYDSDTIEFFKNNVSQGQKTSVGFDTSYDYVALINLVSSFKATANFGQDSTFAGATTAGGNSDANGVGDFKYSVPSGYLALCSANLPEPVVGPLGGSISTENFNTVLYTGNDGTQSITGVGFNLSTDGGLVWIKQRSAPDRAHRLNDSVRGVNRQLYSNLTNSEGTATNELTSFDSDGFSLGSANGVNGIDNYAAWNWKAGGTASSNTDGSITTQVSANTDAGFSIFETTSNPTDTLQTYGHGLNQAPELVFIKTLDSSQGWLTYHKDNGFDKYMLLNGSGGATSLTDAFANVTDTVVQTRYFASQSDIVGYCFHSVDGYSKVGSYTGGGSNFPFVYTGFRPAWLMVRSIGVGHWLMFDATRHPTNVNDLRLFANLTNGDDSAYALDLLSNGFKLRHTGSDFNTSGQTYIYLAFAETPQKFANAR